MPHISWLLIYYILTLNYVNNLMLVCIWIKVVIIIVIIVVTAIIVIIIIIAIVVIIKQW